MYHTMSSLFAEASISLSGLVWHLIEERFTSLVAWDRGEVHVIEEFPVRVNKLRFSSCSLVSGNVRNA